MYVLTLISSTIRYCVCFFKKNPIIWLFSRLAVGTTKPPTLPSDRRRCAAFDTSSTISPSFFLLWSRHIFFQVGVKKNVDLNRYILFICIFQCWWWVNECTIIFSNEKLIVYWIIEVVFYPQYIAMNPERTSTNSANIEWIKRKFKMLNQMEK